jgi:hypothetical protein
MKCISQLTLSLTAYGINNFANAPCHLTPWEKIFLGWLEPIEIDTNGRYEIRDSETTTDTYVIKKNYHLSGDEYLLIENRQPKLFDEQLWNGGMLIWHIDDTKRHMRERGYPGQEGWPSNDRHYQIALLAPDGRYDLETGRNSGDSADFWREGMEIGPGLVEPLATSAGTYPNTNSYQSGLLAQTGIRIYDISASGDTMSFSVGGLGGEPATLTPTTSAPTDSPTSSAPTVSPTTSTPTVAPITLTPITGAPTLFPSEPPSVAPTKPPSPRPSLQPSLVRCMCSLTSFVFRLFPSQPCLDSLWTLHCHHPARTFLREGHQGRIGLRYSHLGRAILRRNRRRYHPYQVRPLVSQVYRCSRQQLLHHPMDQQRQLPRQRHSSMLHEFQRLDQICAERRDNHVRTFWIAVRGVATTAERSTSALVSQISIKLIKSYPTVEEELELLEKDRKFSSIRQLVELSGS